MEKISLVLEGGGAKGAYHCGVIMALDEIGVEFNAVAGASIGAINAGMYVQGKMQQLENFWKNFEFGQFSPVKPETLEAITKKKFSLKLVKEASKDFFGIFKKIKKKASSGFEYLATLFSEEKIRESEIDLGLTVFNMSQRKGFEYIKKDIPEGKLVDYILASATYPLFSPYIIDGEKFYDGGIYDNMPVNLLAKNGYKKILAVRTNLIQKRTRKKINEEGIDLFYIAPEEKLGTAMGYTDDKKDRLIEVGYNQTNKLLKEGNLMRFLEA